MPKITIEYNLPEEISEFNTAHHSRNLASIIWNLDKWLRNKQNYTDILAISIEEIRGKIAELLEEEGLNFDSNIF